MKRNDKVDICPNCGNRCTIDDVNCPKCGKNLDDLFEQLDANSTINKGGAMSSAKSKPPGELDHTTDVTFDVWASTAASVFGATKMNIKLTPTHVMLMEPLASGASREKIKVAKQKAHLSLKFLDQPFAGKKKTQHLDGMSQVSLSNMSGTIMLAMDPDAFKKFQEWMPPLTSEIKEKVGSRGRAGYLFMLGAGQFGLLGFANLIGGVACFILAALNFLVAHRAMRLLNGVVLAAAGVMNIIMGELLPILLGIVSLLWGLGELWAYWSNKK